MAVSVEELKTYLRIDSEDENDLLVSLLDVGLGYLHSAISDFDTKYEYETFANKADLVQKIIAGELYQNRDSRNDGRSDFSFTVRSIISQLQYFVPPQEVSNNENDGESDQTN